MRYYLPYILSLLLLWNCKNPNIQEKTSETNPVFIKLGLYPSFDQPAEIMVNLNEDYILLCNASPFAYDGLDLEDQNNMDVANKQFSLVSDSAKYGIVPFYATLSSEESDQIISKINAFTHTDFNPDLKNIMLDGMGFHFQILYSNHVIKEINPINFPSKNQFELSKLLIDMVEYKNQNPINKSIILTIKEYNEFLENQYKNEKD